jgi:tetratricopeptide (TPR) repeat protein
MKQFGKELFSTLLHRAPRVRDALVRIAGADDAMWRRVSDAACEIDPKDPETARLLHLAVARLLPNDAHAQYRAGGVMRQALRYDEAIDYMARAVRLDPGFDPFRGSLIGLAFEHMDYDDAIKLHDSLPPAPANVAGTARRHLALQLMRLKRVEEAVARCGDVFGPACRSISEAADGPGKYSARVTFEGAGYHIAFGPEFLYWPFLVDRVLGLTPYLTRFAATRPGSGSLQLTLGDAPDGDGHQLCFSGDKPQHHLVPDPIFLQSNAYAHFRAQVAEVGRQWTDRKDQLYWRGSLTGQAETFEEIFALPRVKLVEMSLADPQIDARLTDLSQFGPLLPALEIECVARGLIGKREAEIDSVQYRYVIDVDGNTNSWPGLWTKLASGGTVIKLGSCYRQWYYERLRHGENVCFIDDLERLPAVLEDMRRDEVKAQSLAEASVALTRSMRPESEYHFFEKAAHSALAA